MPDPDDALAAEIAALRIRVTAMEQTLRLVLAELRALSARIPGQQQQQPRQVPPPVPLPEDWSEPFGIEPSEPWNLGPPSGQDAPR